MKYILILALVSAFTPCFGQKSDWTDADRKRVTELCTKSIPQEAKDLAKKNKVDNDRFVNLANKVLVHTSPMACSCFVEKAESKYPKRNDFAAKPDPALVKALSMMDEKAPNAKLLQDCSSASVMDSTKSMGWGVGLEDDIKQAFFTAAYDGLNKDQIKAFDACAFAKLKEKYPNLFYAFSSGKLAYDLEVYMDCAQSVKK